MLKALVILALFGILIGAYDASAAPNPAGQAKASQHPAKPAPPLAAPQGNNGATFQYNSQPENDKSGPCTARVILPPKDRYDYIAFGANILLMAAAIFTAFWVCIQAVETKRAAGAALLNAKAVINAERAWVMRDPTRDPGIPDLAYPLNETAFPILWVKNFGHSPGTIFFVKVELQLGDGRDGPPHPGMYTEEPAANGQSEFPLPPREVHPFKAAFPFEAREPDALRNAVLGSKKFLWFCAAIHYFDIFVEQGKEHGGIHKTHFCFLYETLASGGPFWRMAGPALYNRAT
jgi:hypothetical protein